MRVRKKKFKLIFVIIVSFVIISCATKEEKDTLEENKFMTESIKSESKDKNENSVKDIVDNEENIIIEKDDNKILAYFYDILEKKYNLHLDISYYDIDDNNNEASFLVTSNESNYNNYKGILKFKYDLTKKGFPKNEKIIDKYDMVSVDGIENKEKNHLVVTEKDNAGDLYVKIRSILLEKQKDENIQKTVTTYEELVAKRMEMKRKEEFSEYGGDLDNIDSAVNDWFYDNRERQSRIINIGDGLKLETMKFGRYPQTKNEKRKEDIEWYVLANSDGKKLLISKYILDNKRFTENSVLATWDDSTIRDWLNGDFYNTAFNNKEKKKIIETEIKSTAIEEEYDVVTKDKVFLLSFEEYKKYFKGVTNFNVNPYGSTCATEYAKIARDGNRGLAIEEKSQYWSEAYAEGNSCYWLRDRRKSILDEPSDQVVNVSGIGQVLSESFYDSEHAGVRPVILISESHNSNVKKQDSKKEENEISKSSDEQKLKGVFYKFLLKLGNKDLYIDVRTNIFTFEGDERVVFGRLREDGLYEYELSELDEQIKNYYYFDKEKETLYFVDWSEKHNDGSGIAYTSLCMIDKSLNKIKIAERVKSYIVLKNEVIFVYGNNKDVYIYKNGKEDKLDLGEYRFNLKGNNGEEQCYIYKKNEDKTEEWYLYNDMKITKVSKPKE